MHPYDERAPWLARHVLPHEPALRAWLQKRRAHGLDVDDIVQETYARLSMLEHVDHIRDVRTYTFQIAHSVIATFIRRSRVVSITAVGRIDTFDIALDEPDPESCICDRDELQRLLEEIMALPQKVRDVFVLRRVEGLSQRQVANRLGLSESTVEKHMSKAFHQLSISFGRGGKRHRGASEQKNQGIRQADGRPDKLGD